MSSTKTSEVVKVLEIAKDPRLSSEVKAFLKALNSGDGPPLEALPPLEAREVLVNAQASVNVDLSGIDESADFRKPLTLLITQSLQVMKIDSFSIL